MMAGRRRDTGRPPQALLRQQRRLAQLDTELAVATTPSRRVSAVAGYLSGVLKHTAPDVAERIADEVVRQLKDAGHRANNADQEGTS